MFAGPWFGLKVGIFTVGASNHGIEGEQVHPVTVQESKSVYSARMEKRQPH